jgi:hypothetical protein
MLQIELTSQNIAFIIKRTSKKKQMNYYNYEEIFEGGNLHAILENKWKTKRKYVKSKASSNQKFSYAR